ncbi:hypothetical protein MtrunA17_Chr6g0474481 [Medicago truncatula]|uniref:Uncharacterized protein n=1 Tax=Medicago truncatula TaxID=3880 RepID=A0A396HM33_MEDTR|nr:hypothetical protein MtrunA17_Chr6g0474481 [Medicago truncatula]
MKKSCKSANQEHPKICEDFGKTKNEDSRGLRRLYSGRNFVPKFQGNLFEDVDLKRRKIEKTGHKKHFYAPRTHVMCLEHGKRLPCA